MNGPTKIIECPICLDPMSKPIVQCVNGHSIHQECVQANSVTDCPQCRGKMTEIRCFQLEQLIDSLKVDVKLSCSFASKGCKTLVKMADVSNHENECQYRSFPCEGKTFVGWNCDWNGDTTGLHNHFKEKHPNNARMEFTIKQASVQINFNENHKDLHIISFYNGQNYFYFKHIVDVAKQKVFWFFQLVGPKHLASHYYYEFEIHKGPVKKFKVTEFCESAFVNVKDIIENEKCVAVSFASLKNFLDDEGEVAFTYRIMSVKRKPTVSR